jgi:hypothetical protein
MSIYHVNMSVYSKTGGGCCCCCSWWFSVEGSHGKQWRKKSRDKRKKNKKGNTDNKDC